MTKLTILGILFSASVWASEETTLVIKKPNELSAATTLTTAATDQKSEKDILLNVDLAKKSSDTASATTRIFVTAFILISVMGATYMMVRRYKLSNNINKSNTRIKILSQHYLGPKKSLAIIHVAGESILIGVTDTQISMIKSLSLIDDEVPTDLPQSFSDTLQINSQKPAGATARTSTTDELEEEFSFSGVKDSVSKKLKSMRSLS